MLDDWRLDVIPIKKKQVSTDTASKNKYIREIKGKLPDGIDVYSVIESFNVTCPARQHAIKKILCTSIRGKGDSIQDLNESIQALQRALQLETERIQKGK